MEPEKLIPKFGNQKNNQKSKINRRELLRKSELTQREILLNLPVNNLSKKY